MTANTAENNGFRSMEELEIIKFWSPIQPMLLNFRDRTPKRTDRGAIELLDAKKYLL
jgi:hypothetical protein